MSMTMADWERSVASEVFRTSRPPREDRGRDDRLFLNVLHSFSAYDIIWHMADAA